MNYRIITEYLHLIVPDKYIDSMRKLKIMILTLLVSISIIVIRAIN